MSTDRELLELAAKAAGGKFSPGTTKHRTGETWDDWEWIGPQGIDAPCFTGTGYPLTNDGDALRLAVILGFDEIAFFPLGDPPGITVNDIGISIHETYAQDPCAATRRAIVRAAAEIGKAMP